ncbi:MAG: hypothetical protein Q7J47_11985 [Azoarcus sp.]|nr:hypothetical protein [Azoarcus sp.]
MEKIDARKLLREALEHIRRQAFVLRQQGYGWVHIAEVVGVHVATVLKWARRAGANGVNAGRFTFLPIRSHLIILLSCLRSTRDYIRESPGGD